MADETAIALGEGLMDQDGTRSVADGLLEIASALMEVAAALRGIEEGLTTAKVGEALDGLASLKYKDFPA